MKKIYAALLASTVILSSVSMALAQAASSVPPAVLGTDVTIPWGSLVGQIGVVLVPWAAVALMGVIAAIAPAPVRAFLNSQRTQAVEQIIERGLGYGAAQLQADLAGKTLTLDMHNRLIAQAVQYIDDHASAEIKNFIGGSQAMTQKVAARVLTSPAVNAAVQGSTAPVQASAVVTSKK